MQVATKFNLRVAEAVAVYPEEALDKNGVNVASIPSSGNQSFNLEINEGELAKPTDLVKIDMMMGGDSFDNFPCVYVIYLTPRRKYIRRVRVAPEGAKIPIPSSMAVFNVSRAREGFAREGFITLPAPVDDNTAFNSSLEEIDIVNDLKEVLNARIIVFHDLNDAVRYLMCFANHDLKAGKDTWVAEWSNLVQDKITRASLRFRMPWGKIAWWGSTVLAAYLVSILLNTFVG